MKRAFLISQLVAWSILWVGGWFFRESEPGMLLVLTLAFGVGLPLFHALQPDEPTRGESADDGTPS
jgi:hypothetical protein